MILYNGDKNDSTNFISTSFLQVNSCGVQIMKQNKTKVFRKNGRFDYHMLFMCDGDCRVFYHNESYILKKGHIALYPPNTPQEYILSKNSKSIWIHFNGFDIANILTEAKIHEGVHFTPHSSLLEKMLLQLISEHNNKLEITNEKGLFLSFLFELGKTINNNYFAEDKISKCIRFITTHYNVNISVDELAKSCNLSQSRFLHLFKASLGASPHSYQLQLRINNAKHLLSSTNHNIAEISTQLGYDDPLYFSRVFKKKTGMSPSQYRNLYM